MRGRGHPPRDPLLSTTRIQWGWLQPATQRDYLHALAAIAARFPAEPASHTRAARAAIAAGQHPTPLTWTWP